jgi:hypothetical protein
MIILNLKVQGGLLKDYRNNIYSGDENIKVQFETKDELMDMFY